MTTPLVLVLTLSPWVSSHQLAQSHEYDKTLLNLCASSLVLLTHAGCLEHAVASAFGAGFIEAEQEAVNGHLAYMFDNFFLWKRFAAADLTSDELRSAPLHSAALVFHLVGAALGAPYEARDFSGARSELEAESNLSIPHHSVSEQERAKLHAMVAAAAANFSGDARLTGWTWSC